MNSSGTVSNNLSTPPSQRSFLKTWWYAIRPHTLGASIAPLIIAGGALWADESFSFLEYFLCLIVALSAQISSNIANDYFDYKGGKDTADRVGFERLLTKGVVTPGQMFGALVITTLTCALAGGILVWMGGWIILLIGLATLLGIFAYSSGPFPLSHHGLGDLAVVIFFGLIPVLGTYYVVAGTPPLYLMFLALGIGLWEANILVVNNYRDYQEDSKSGKKTIIVRMGVKSGPRLYALNTLLSIFVIMLGLYTEGSTIAAIIVALLLTFVCFVGVYGIQKLKGKRLNGLLKFTNKVAILMSIILSLSLIF
ncbi:1,4-dihydroxy-2-naphthoate octaprenyltransferase [Porphyromonas cangingivalis]|nr:1,4-dihydroxy-2-naphthoate octaprenyltransferase [Porphyromonas cangingivalis]